MNKRFWSLVSLVVIAAMALASCSTPAATTQAPTSPMNTTAPMPTNTTAAAMNGIDCAGAKKGDTLTMFYQWSGQEEASLDTILKPLVDACGIVIQPTATRDPAVLDTQVKGGTPPDVAFWQLPQAVEYQSQLVTMDALGGHKENYAQYFLDQGTIGGKWLALAVKLDVKTIIWYSPSVFQSKGYTVPTTWDQLNTLVAKMVADGNVPWSTGFESGAATGWTGADFIEDIMLVQQGPQYVMNIITGKTPYNDPGVKQAYQTYLTWATDAKYAIGGAQGTLSTNYNTAIDKAFSDPPEALMVRQSGFASGEITTKYPSLKYGTDFDFFGVPGAQGLQAGYDWMLAFKNTPAVEALVRYLTSTLGGQNWAKAGFDLTPNSAGAGLYTDTVLQKKAALFANAKGVVPSIGDVIPGGFGTAQSTTIVDAVNGKDLDTELATVAAAQKAALNP